MTENGRWTAVYTNQFEPGYDTSRVFLRTVSPK